MASTTPLPTLLKQLNIGVHSDEESHQQASSSGSTIRNVPKLSLTDQLHLLSAHIDTLEKSIKTTVSSSESRDLISKQTRQAVEIQQKVNGVQNRVNGLEELGKMEDAGGEAVLEGLAQFVSAQKTLEKQKWAHKAAILMRDAVSALEALESRLESSQLDAAGLASAIKEADYRASLLGLRGVKSDTSGDRDAEDFRWLAQTGSTPPVAIRELGSRLEKAKEGIQRRLLAAWNEHVTVSAEEETKHLKINENGLSQLLTTLQSRRELEPLLEKLAGSLLHSIIQPLLKDKRAWALKEDSLTAWQYRGKTNYSRLYLGNY
jgi:hypothetical protein